MRIILPFKKEVILSDNISDITSIALEDDLSVNDNLVCGNFMISGEYLVSDATKSVLPFNFDLPVNMALDDDYDTTLCECYVDDFYYEIVDNSKISVSIDIAVDKLKEKEIKNNNKIIDSIPLDDIKESEVISIDTNNTEINEKNKVEEKEDKKEDKKNNLFNTNYDNQYMSYLVYIIRENDSIESILEKYQIDLDTLKNYNDVSDLKLGDKVIIPSK